MTKFYFLVLSTLLVLNCSSSSNVSEVRVPVAVSKNPQLPQLDSLNNTQILLTAADTADVIAETDSVQTGDLPSFTQEQPDTSGSDVTEIKVEEKKSTESDKIKKTVSIKPTVPATPIPPIVKSSEKKTVFEYRNFNRDAHRTGEKLTFDINYLAITAGEATMSVPEEFMYNNRLVQKILFEAKSSRAYSWIYKVEDKYISYLDKSGIYPWKFNKEINEGSFHTKEEVIFDPVKQEAIEDNKTVKIPPYTHDIISAFYFIRNNDLSNKKPGDIIELSNYSSGKIHPLDVIFKGWEKIKVPAGTFNCVVLEPLVKAGGLFKDEGSLVIWLTNDELKIPVKVETKVVIGSINVELKKIEGVNRAIPAKVN